MSDQLVIAGRAFKSRLIVGTGKYRSFQEMARAHTASGVDMVTVAVRRVNLTDKTQERLVDFIDPKKYTYLPNTGSPTPVKLEESGETAGSAAGGSSAKSEEAPALVKCSFTSDPAGAEIAIDGRYVGSTPSDLSLTVGKHDVVISLSGFAQWKRELVVSQESQLTIHAVLEKTP